MLTKCMLTPLKLARLMEWNGRLGKPSAIMAIDITNRQIGVALAYHRRQTSLDDTLPEHPHAYNSGSSRSLFNSDNSPAITTTLTALPPIPYMSYDPYHPSYAFLHHHRCREADATRRLAREDRTMEVADQLAQLATDRNVKGVLIRWPGDTASAVSSGETNEEASSDVAEGHLLLPSDENRRNGIGASHITSDGSMGYMRGRILYVLDKCCTGHGHNQNNIPSDPLLVEGARPFALFDTSVSERSWIIHQQKNKYAKAVRPIIPERRDKYGNTVTEMDLWGRAAIFGNQPPQPQQGKFHYSSKQQYTGYRVSSQFGSVDNRKGVTQSGNENFDCLHDNESRMDQFQGSLSAMHALYDFATENLQGRIVLPQSWVSSPVSISGNTRSEMRFDDKYTLGDDSERQNNARKSRLGLTDVTSMRPGKKSSVPSANNKDGDNTIMNNKTNGLVTLAEMPRRKSRRRGKRGV
mmetsp:Transcript_15675/g.33116  ORF Transcript_15675/g.33116 Transcript_15675/m.33116 type:complete len:467 (-) Transcript_15675:85-1485(-)